MEDPQDFYCWRELRRFPISELMVDGEHNLIHNRHPRHYAMTGARPVPDDGGSGGGLDPAPSGSGGALGRERGGRAGGLDNVQAVTRSTIARKELWSLVAALEPNARVAEASDVIRESEMRVAEATDVIRESEMRVAEATDVINEWEARASEARDLIGEITASDDTVSAEDTSNATRLGNASDAAKEFGA